MALLSQHVVVVFRSMIFVALMLATLFVSPAFSTSRNGLKEDQNLQKGFQVTLRRVDSSGATNLTRFERLQRGMKRGNQRLQTLMMTGETDVKSPIYPGNGEFLMTLSIGTPSRSYSAIMDTGSDLIWTQCKPCKDCFEQTTPIFDPKKSSSFSSLSCSNNLCQALLPASSSCGTSNDHDHACEYLYSYGDYSSTQGVLASETFTFGEVSVPNVAFGCGEDNEGSGFSQGAGLVGLGRGPLSLVSQLYEPKFSYCLTSIDDQKSSSKLLMGSLASSSSKSSSSSSKLTTPLLKNPSQPSFYYLDLEGITVGNTLLPIKKSNFKINDDGSGGVIIDSGTTITYLVKSAFDLVKKEFISQVKLPVDDSGSTGLDLCFNLPSNTNDIKVPKLVFHFKGADLELPGENYVIADSGIGLACLAMGSSSGGMSIFGNVQQQNILVLHDLQKETISFIPTDCSQL